MLFRDSLGPSCVGNPASTGRGGRDGLGAASPPCTEGDVELLSVPERGGLLQSFPGGYDEAEHQPRVWGKPT